MLNEEKTKQDIYSFFKNIKLKMINNNNIKKIIKKLVTLLQTFSFF